MINEHTQTFQQLSSSLRVLPLEESLRRAKAVAAHYGLTRVTDTTQLDLIGIPVFASIRPEAEQNSLCVHAGKGIRSEEARVGAYMEAIEFAAAEFKRRIVEVYEGTPREIDDQPAFRARFVDLCPLLGLSVDPDASLTCTTAQDIVTGEPVGVPAELVFFPFTKMPPSASLGPARTGCVRGTRSTKPRSTDCVKSSNETCRPLTSYAMAPRGSSRLTTRRFRP